jgi:hypothetical protein
MKINLLDGVSLFVLIAGLVLISISLYRAHRNYELNEMLINIGAVVFGFGFQAAILPWMVIKWTPDLAPLVSPVCRFGENILGLLGCIAWILLANASILTHERFKLFFKLLFKVTMVAAIAMLPWVFMPCIKYLFSGVDFLIK